MTDFNDSLVTQHLVLKSGDRHIGPFPPKEVYVRHWAETNGYPVDALEFMGEPWRESWDISSYIVTDDLPGPTGFMVRVKTEPSWLFFEFENIAKRWMDGEGADRVEQFELTVLFHPFVLDKEPISFHPPKLTDQG